MPSNANNLEGRVAVITGGANGIGLALALEAANRGMHVALADIGEEALLDAKAQVEALGVKAIAVKTDVRDIEQIRHLEQETIDQLGEPWLVCNNAGIAKIALAWETSETDWRRMMDINVWGVVNGLLTFLPGLRARKSGYILNTASVGGLLSMPGNAAYVASKHAIVGLSETLYRELSADKSRVGISVLCPALVRTAIAGTREVDGKKVSVLDSPDAMDPAEVARVTFDAIVEGQFWILTHASHVEPKMRARLDQMLEQRNPDHSSVDPAIEQTATKATGVDFVHSS
ncbi:MULTISPECIES: SDR family NAD(P)-dependent oxidoreductase [unclassified Novosphingobium]|uniref:SDR family NAD(P)-dependent oxidoreductase n=1 Tax=unclassified Novosphingobium TaxID=2644732 RepID=UPI001447B47C|nr:MULTISPECIES: SDR family NAD(P)-dependent oxidoreductase [unclassified Novosphingobium]NKJ43947.1 short-subunit dehydrogenase [Novosphingobium sp. SG720]NMN06411.1 short-subunit dehydrogenase [Novosphingobium sp. SG919]NMN88709.1 short-subunit dehydrogenase [Novosphingobium sp. SG916]